MIKLNLQYIRHKNLVLKYILKDMHNALEAL